jgi:glycosyltransferase involved in cell wall biosynthesis
MKIGIDARFLTHPQRGGFKTYTENLVSALGEVDLHNQYVLYVDRPPTGDISFKPANFSFRVVPATYPLIGTPIREQVGLRREIYRDNLDVVHFMCNTAPVNLSLNYVVTLHDTIQLTNSETFKFGSTFSSYKRWAMTAYSKWTILRSAKSAKGIITVSGYVKNEIVEQLKVSPQSVFVTHLAPNPLFAPATSEQKASWRKEVARELGIRGRFVLGIGYEPRKNIPLLIETFATIVPRQSNLKLVVVAANEVSRHHFQQLAQDLGVEDCTTILGGMPPLQLNKLYNLAELLVFPSEQEGFGLPPLEAIACGTPVIAMKMTSIPEVLGDGAVLLEGKDVQTWANAIEHIMVDQEFRSRLVRRGLCRAAQLSWQHCARETLQIYTSVTSSIHPIASSPN